MSVLDWPRAAGDWLQHGLLDRLLSFIERAINAQWAMDVAIYEYELPAIVQAVNAAFKRGVRVLYHAKIGDAQSTINQHNLRSLPAKCKKSRVTSKIFHDKYIVLSKKSGNKFVPHAVLCGSTNFTENGVYRQANVVHIIDDKKIAVRYADVFEVLWKNPRGSAVRDWINVNNPIANQGGFSVGFTPRSGGDDLTAFVKIIEAANADLLFCTAFALPDRILQAILGQAHDGVLRFGLQNTKSAITGYHGDRSAEFSATANLGSGIENWTPESLHGQEGSLRVHLKAVIANFTTDSPVVLSGSHNLSDAASGGNDENFLIMRASTDLADRYGLEVLRFYEHYRYRWTQQQRGKNALKLTIDDAWLKDYYTPGHIKQIARVRFVGR